MDINFTQTFQWAIAQGWIIPVIGVGVCGLAFLVGRRFFAGRGGEHSSDPAELFDSHFLKGVSQDRRSAPRRKGNTVELRLSAGGQDETLRGWILDRSIGGLGILIDRALPIGTV